MKYVCLLVLVSVLSACEVTGPADDRFGKDKGSLDSPKLGGGEGFVLYDSDKGEKNTASTSPSINNSDDIEYNTDAPTDYESYQQWREAKSRDSAEYERFKRWQEYEDFLQWKKNQ